MLTMGRRVFTPSGYRGPGAGIVMIVAGMLAGIAAAFAQGGPANRWEEIDAGIRSGFGDENMAFYDVYFQTPLHGFLFGLSTYATTDGGDTWKDIGSPVLPRPHRILPSKFGYSSDCYVTQDGGANWYAFQYDALSPDLTHYSSVELSAWSQRLLVTLATNQYFYLDEDGNSDSEPVYRLLYTIDGGRQWTIVDSLAPRSYTDGSRIGLGGTMFGALPPQSPVLSGAKVEWLRLAGMTDSVTLYAIIYAHQKVDDKYISRYHLGRLNLATKKVTWFPMPMLDDLEPTELRRGSLAVEFITAATAYMRVVTGPSWDRVTTLFRSDDSGATWTKLPSPSWLDLRSARFISPTSIVAYNGASSDGGMTWTRRNDPFYEYAIVNRTYAVRAFYALDSMRHYVAGGGALFARTTDGGSTWERNGASPPARTVAAFGGRVVIGREFRSLLLSTDYGRTWRDVADEGKVPPHLSSVNALSFPDTINAPETIIGLARYIPKTEDPYVGIIRSSDGGSTWIEGPRIETWMYEDVELHLAPPDARGAIRGFIKSYDRIHGSDDGGLTWELRDTSRRFYRAFIPDGMNGLGVDMDSLATFITGDGGRSWRRTQFDSSLRLIGLHVQEGAHHALFVETANRASRGVLTRYRSSDTMKTWTLDLTGSDRYPYHVVAHWIDSARFSIVEYDSILYHTSNGGRSFDEHGFGFRGIIGRDARYFYVAQSDRKKGTDARLIGRWLQDPALTGVESGGRDGMHTVLLTNPVRGGEVSVRCELRHGGDVAIEVVDLLGSIVTRRMPGYREAGTHDLSLDVAGLPEGRYLVRVLADGGVRCMPLLLLR